MRVIKEQLSFDAYSGIGVISLNPTMSLGLVAPYQQQARDINQMLQNDVTRELYHEFKRLQNRAVFCLNEKEKTLEEATRKNREMEISLRQALEEATRKNREMEVSLRQALADANSWKEVANQKTALGQELAKKLYLVRKKEIANHKNAEKEFAEEAASSTGENGDDDVDTAWTRRCKRRCL